MCVGGGGLGWGGWGQFKGMLLEGEMQLLLYQYSFEISLSLSLSLSLPRPPLSLLSLVVRAFVYVRLCQCRRVRT